jgi:serine/threonine protein kinase
VAALEEALLGAGIRGSLREQARALERSAAPPPRHRRLPSDPNAPEFAVVAAATLSPHDGAPQGGGGGGRQALWEGASAGPSPLGSRGRSISMALLQPTKEEEEAPQGRQRARDRRYSVEVTRTGAARVSVPGQSKGGKATAAVPSMGFLDWEQAQAEHHARLALGQGDESGSPAGQAEDHETGDDDGAPYGSGSDDVDGDGGSQEHVVMFGAPRRGVGSVASEYYDDPLGPGQEAYMDDDEWDEHEHEDDDGLLSDEDGVSWDGEQRGRLSGEGSDDSDTDAPGDAMDRHFGMPSPPPEHAPVQRVGRAREGRCRSRDPGADSGGAVRAWDADPSIGECATCAASPVRAGPGDARDPPPSPAVPSAATSPCKPRARLSTHAYLVTEEPAPEKVERDAEPTSQDELLAASDEPAALAAASAATSPVGSIASAAAVRRVSSTEQAAVANRIQWERTVSSLDSLLTGTGTAGEDGNDPYGAGGSIRGRPGGDPLTDACTRASQRVSVAVAAARHLFSLNGMLSSPDAAPLRVAFKEAREFAEALASVQPAARRLLMSDLASSVADASSAAATGIQELTKHLQTQRRHCRTCEEGPAPDGAAAEFSGLPAACADVSGVVAGAKPLGEALHALMRWARNVTEFAEPGMVAGATGGDASGVGLAQLEAMSAQFTALFMRLALLWGALVAAAHSARRLGVDDWRWAHALEDLGKDQLLFVRSLSLQGFTQGAGAGMDFAALKDTVDATVVIVKALDAELSMATPQLPMDGGQAQTPLAPEAGPAGGPGPADASSVPQRDGWEVDMTDVRLGHKVGAGSYGQVFRATWRAAPVAVKLFDKQYADSEELLANVRREAALMARHRHPHVVLFMGVCTRPPNLAIVTEFCDNGSLLDVLKAKREDPGSLPWVRRLAFGADAARGLNYLHTSRPATIHADLNTSNLLVDRGWRVKVGDFGLSRLLQNAQSGGVVMGTNVANKNASHLAPEVLRSEPYGTPSDVFSFGCVLWTLTTLAVPWERLQVQGNNLAIAHAIAYEHQRLELPPTSVPPFPDLQEYNALITDCFQEDPGQRPRMDAVLERLVHMQQRCIRRTKEDDHAASAAAGTEPPTPTHGKALSMSSHGGNGNGQSASRPPRFSSDALSPTHAVYSLHRQASSRIAAAVAAAAEWGPPSTWGPGTTLAALGALPLCTAALAWCAARYVYVQKQSGSASM